MEYLTIKNWETYQHYHSSTRSGGPWIKLYNVLLSDYDFLRLSEKNRLHLIMIWLLANRIGNKIPNDPAYVKSEIGAKSNVDLDLLTREGWLLAQDSAHASNMLAQIRLDQRRSEEIRSEEKTQDPLEMEAWNRDPRYIILENIQLGHNTDFYHFNSVDLERSQFVKVRSDNIKDENFRVSFRITKIKESEKGITRLSHIDQ